MRNKGLSKREFLDRVREYLPGETGVFETNGAENLPGQISLEQIEENTFFLFDSEALLAFSHAIEDFALEEASGSLLATMQSWEQFEPHRERYWQLAATLQEVEIIAAGKFPRRNGFLKFCNDAKKLVKQFWMVLYQSDEIQVMFLCEQANDAKKFGEKQFIGFYTFNPRIITQAREDMAESLGGRCPELQQFAQSRKIDRAAKHLKVEFGREKKAMEIATQKLQSQEEKYQPKHFLADLEKILERLNRLQTHLPELIVEPQKQK
ncbi:MAG: DICT sensory domain-containing protein [Verrucomicrobiota bacterium]